MEFRTKQELIRELAKEYRKLDWQSRQKLINQLVRVTGYHRTYASYLLNNPPKDRSESKSQNRRKGKRRPSKYRKVLPHLKEIWEISNRACGKRLVGMVPSYIETLVRDKVIEISEENAELLKSASAATLDRLLKGARGVREGGRGISTTKPGSLLKSKIPVKVFTPWNERKPGFLEVDLVAHCGGSTEGDFAYTLDVTDLDLGWSECQAFLGRGEYATLEAMKEIQKRLPVPILGIDSDNDAPFINYHFYRWSQREKITFTRCRPYRKNDQAHIEQKNWSIVRRYVGYHRYDTKQQVRSLNHLYEALHFYQNLFQSTMKLEKKERVGSKVKRVYGKSMTPYQRALNHPDVDEEKKQELRQLYQHLNPAYLLEKIDRISLRLLDTLRQKNTP